MPNYCQFASLTVLYLPKPPAPSECDASPINPPSVPTAQPSSPCIRSLLAVLAVPPTPAASAFFYAQPLDGESFYLPISHRRHIRPMFKSQLIELLSCNRTYFKRRMRAADFDTGRAKRLSVAQVIFIFHLFDWPALPEE